MRSTFFTSFAPLVREGLFPEGVPCINMEGACASGSLAFHCAWKDILSGQSQRCPSLLAEKTYFPHHMELVLQSFIGGTDIEELPRLHTQLAEISRECGKPWATSISRTLFMDIYAALGAWHMHHWGTTREQIAMVAAEKHLHGSMNPWPSTSSKYRWKKYWPTTKSAGS